MAQPTIVPVILRTWHRVNHNQSKWKLYIPPDVNFYGLYPDIFYNISDGEYTASARLRIMVNAVNDPPVTLDDYIYTTEAQDYFRHPCQ